MTDCDGLRAGVWLFGIAPTAYEPWVTEGGREGGRGRSVKHAQ